MIPNIFAEVLHMSLAASILIFLVLVARYFLRKGPKLLCYLLWFGVFFRLLCPFSLTFTVPAVTIPVDIEQMTLNVSEQLSDSPAVLPVEPGELPAVSNEDVPKQPVDLLTITSHVWLLGVCVLAMYQLISYWKLKRSLAGAVPHYRGYYLAEHITSPFVTGLFPPKIYLPANLPKENRAYILAHERHHISRGDHLAKLIAFVAVCVHWFNPLVWLSFQLLVNDMEMSCDEAVLKKMDPNFRSDYAQLILDMAVGKQRLRWTPLTFGEGNVSARIRNVLSWRKASPATMVPAMFLTVAILACSLISVQAETAELPVETGQEYTAGESTILRKYAPDAPQTLNSQQEKLLLSALENASRRLLDSLELSDIDERFRVTLDADAGGGVLIYGYVKGDDFLFMSGSDGMLYVVDDGDLTALLSHFYACYGTVQLQSDELPSDAQFLKSEHSSGVLDYYSYFCPICGETRTGMISYLCGDCPGCNGILASIRASAEEIIVNGVIEHGNSKHP